MLQVSALFPYQTNLPGDVAVNVWHFRTVDPEPSAGEITTAVTSLLDFYYEPMPTGSLGTIAQRMAPWILFGTGTTRFRVVGVNPATGAELGSPIFVNYAPPSFPAPTAENLPLEVAVCLSFKGYYSEGSVATRAQRRGRVFIGPLGLTAAELGAITAPPKPGLGITTLLREKAIALRDNAQTGAGTGGASAPWVIWSRTSGDQHNVVGGWIDNAFDTQRRRGNAPTQRTTWGDQT